MKKSKSFIALIVCASILALVGSCEEHDEKMEVKYEFNSSVPSGDPNSAPGGPMGEATYDTKVGDPIDLATARKWAANYRSKLTKTDERQAHYFGSDILQQILGQSDCIGIRIYYGIDDAGNKQLMLIGVDSNGENLIPSAGARLVEGDNIIGDASFPCPNTCPGNGL
ncbi:MAG TPA: hypothetical protein VGK39_01090 [Cyclobacteriaceae bacterium]